MNKENCALKPVDEIILYYDARSKKHQTETCRRNFNIDYQYVLCLLTINYYIMCVSS